MFSPEIHYLVDQERQKDRLRELERRWWIQQVAGVQQPGHDGWRGKVASWIGAQMVKWGSKLKRHQTLTQQG